MKTEDYDLLLRGRKEFKNESAQNMLAHWTERAEGAAFRYKWYWANLNIWEKKLKKNGATDHQLVADDKRAHYISEMIQAQHDLKAFQKEAERIRRYIELEEQWEIEGKLYQRPPEQENKTSFGKQLNLFT